MKYQPHTKRLVLEVLKEFPEIDCTIDYLSTPNHLRISNSLAESLDKLEPNKFKVINEFNKLDGVFPMDIAVLRDEEPVAFIEINGGVHYKNPNKLDELNRKDRLKVSLYSLKYPKAKILHVPVMQKRWMSSNNIGSNLASTIMNLPLSK